MEDVVAISRLWKPVIVILLEKRGLSALGLVS